MRTSHRLGAAGLALATTLTACTLIAGVDTIPVLDGGAPALDSSVDGTRGDGGGLVLPHDAGADQAACALEAGIPTSTAACNACLSTYCCEAVISTFVAPANLGSASGYIDCTSSCVSSDAGPSCAYDCVQGEPMGFEIVAPYYACSNYNCAGDCPILGVQDSCLRCMLSGHAGDYHACVEDPACARELSCFDGCGPDAGDCFSRCDVIDGGPSFTSQLADELELCHCNSPAFPP